MSILPSSPIEIFSEGLTHDSGQQLGLEIMFPDHPVRKQAYLDWKIKNLPTRPMEIFSKGLNNDSG